MSPRLSAALKELHEAIDEEVETALKLERAGREKPRDEVSRARARDGLKKLGMLPTTFKRTAKR